MQVRSRLTLEKIVLAAEALIARQGIGSLTMDAVAAEAGISKGGVLHHFRSKEALVTKLAVRKLERIDDALLHEANLLAGRPGSALMGLIEHASKEFGAQEGFSRALLVAAVENSTSLEQFRAMFDDLFTKVGQESTDADLGAALLFAVLGLLVSQTLGFSQLSTEQAQGIFTALRAAASPLGRNSEERVEGRPETPSGPVTLRSHTPSAGRDLG